MNAEPAPLTERQAEVLDLVARYTTVDPDGCPSTFVARRLGVRHQTVRQHFAALYRKGWLRGETCPAVPARPWLAGDSAFRLAFLTR